MHIIEGFLIGLATLLIVGPVVFILINATLINGTKSGISVAIGILVGDFIFALLCINGLNSYLNNAFFNTYLSLIGFVILFGFGLTYILKKENLLFQKTDIGSKTHFQNFLKGFSINFFNPFALSFWILLSKYGSNKYDSNVALFLFAIVVGVLSIDLIKVFLSKKLSPFLNSKKLIVFYKISGIIMILFSFRILYHFLGI